MAKILIDEATVRFFMGPPKNDKKHIYGEAVRRAYIDMSRRTLHYQAEEYKGTSTSAYQRREIIRNEVADYLFKQEPIVLSITTEAEYDKWHETACREITNLFTKFRNGIQPLKPISQATKDEDRKNTFSMGQAQKILNMTWKYIYMLYNYYNAVDNSYSVELASLSRISPFLHAPIDSYVLQAATDAKIGCEGLSYPWSQLLYGEYFEFQKSLREKLRSRLKQDPFLWEIENYPF